MKLGISTIHGESIRPDRPKNFDLFFEFLSRAGVACELIDSRLTLREELRRYAGLLIGAPEGCFNSAENQAVREYVEGGGKILIILKYGGDRVLGANIGQLYREIQPSDDMLVNDRENHKNPYQPLLNLSIQSDTFNFTGRVCYDGGCTFRTSDDFGITIFPSAGCHSAHGTRFQRGRYRYGSNRNPGAIFVYRSIGAGAVLYWGSRWSFSNEMFREYDNSRFYRKVLGLFCSEVFPDNLRHRMSQPQRHRLLHGYPMAAGMKTIDFSPRVLPRTVELDKKKALAIGVIPHPFCNPSVRGCGYCTFPNEIFHPEKEKECFRAVTSEIDSFAKEFPETLSRTVSSVYIGGGTANIGRADLLGDLYRTMRSRFKISNQTEITLEGAPTYFAERPLHMDILRGAFPSSKLRISMGVQTFDADILRRMGRAELNKEGSVEKTMDLAHDREINVSADFLFNLPGQDFEGIETDIRRAHALGIQHVCVYNLVCFKGLGTAWADSPEILRTLPSQAEALQNWLRLHEFLSSMEYKPVTVTDFRLRGSTEEGRYRYEEDLRQPENVDWIGFGPYALSLFTDKNFQRAIKLMNPQGSSVYTSSQKEQGLCWSKSFSYALDDLKIYWITRQIKGTRLSLSAYKKLFGKDIEGDFHSEIQALIQGRLVDKSEDTIELTPEGMYYSDSVAGLIAWFRTTELLVREQQAAVIKKRDWNISVAEWMG